MSMLRTRIFAILMVLLIVFTGSFAQAQGGSKAPVLPPQARPQGLTLSEWHAKFYNAMFAIPAAFHPATGYPWSSCYLAQVGNVGLGVSYFGQGSVSCELPVGMMLYVPVVGTECSTVEAPPFYGGNEQELTACALNFPPSNLQASVDGLPVKNLDSYTSLSPLYQLDLPEGNLLGVPAGSYDSVAYTTGFIVTPLSRGEHTIHVHGELGGGAYIYDWTYFVTVTGK